MQARHEPLPPGEPTPPWIWFLATFIVVALTFGGLFALTRSSDGDTDTATDDGQVAAETSVSSPTTSAVVAGASPTSEPSSTALIPWVGSFIWTEIERSSDGERTAVHRLDLANLSPDRSVITGRLRQDGLSAPTDITVTAQLIDGFVTILASSGSGLSTYVDREVLFRLSGDPAAPTTVLAGLQTLLSPADEGAYFGPGAGGTTDVGDPGSETTTTTDPSTSTSETTSTTTSTTATTAAPTIDRWLGSYTWTEFVGGGASSDQTLIHQLQLTAVATDGSRLLGRLTQNGFQTANDVAVAAEPNGGDVLITVIQVDSVPPAYTAGEVLFLLGGDPANPITTLHELDVLQVSLIPSGSYFTP